MGKRTDFNCSSCGGRHTLCSTRSGGKHVGTHGQRDYEEPDPRRKGK